MSYIINNCPACRDFDVFGKDNKGCCYLYNEYCVKISDCIIKQIVEKCKEDIKPIRQWTKKGTCASMKDNKIIVEQCDTICTEYAKDKTLAQEILQMLGIEEI